MTLHYTSDFVLGTEGQSNDQIRVAAVSQVKIPDPLLVYSFKSYYSLSFFKLYLLHILIMLLNVVSLGDSDIGKATDSNDSSGQFTPCNSHGNCSHAILTTQSEIIQGLNSSIRFPVIKLVTDIK